jgi:hypothetical protein
MPSRSARGSVIKRSFASGLLVTGIDGFDFVGMLGLAIARG